MSHHASSWAIGQTPRTADGKPDAHGKLVLLVLGDLAGTDGVLWHGSKAVAEIACIPPESARRVMARLQEGGYLLKVERFRRDGSRTTSVVVLAPNWARGAMTDPRAHDRFGSDIAAALDAIDPVTETRPPVTETRDPVTQRYGGSEPVIEPVIEPVVVVRADADVIGALIDAGFDDVTIENHRSAIDLVIGELRPPADTDWYRVGSLLRDAKTSGRMKAQTPAAALRFIANGLDGFPVVGQPARKRPAGRESKDDFIGRMLGMEGTA